MDHKSVGSDQPPQGQPIMRSLGGVLAILLALLAGAVGLKVGLYSGLDAVQRLQATALQSKTPHAKAGHHHRAIKGDADFIKQMSHFRKKLYPDGPQLEAQLQQVIEQDSPLIRNPESIVGWMPVECKVMGIHLDMSKAKVIQDTSNSVYRVPDRTTGQRYAYKLFGKSTHYTAEVSFFMVAGNHPHIVRPICVQQERLVRSNKGDSDPPRIARGGIVMEWIEGSYSSNEVARDPRTSLTKLRQMSLQLLGTLKYMHQLGFVHGDLKPDNVLVRPNGELVLIDFGFAVPLPYGHPSRGNPRIKSPELKGLVKAPLDEALDMWAYGCTLAIWYGYYYLPGHEGDKARKYTMLYNGSAWKVGRVPKEFPVELRQVLYLLTSLRPETRRFQHSETLQFLTSLPFFAQH